MCTDNHTNKLHVFFCQQRAHHTVFRDVWEELVLSDPHNLVDTPHTGIRKVYKLCAVYCIYQLTSRGIVLFILILHHTQLSFTVSFSRTLFFLLLLFVTFQVINERYVFMIEENEFKTLFGNECQVQLLKTSYFTTQTGFALPLDSPLKKVFDSQ